jgi:hypothetical protein
LKAEPRYLGVFEGWILPPIGDNKPQVVKGPFTIEVFHDAERGLKNALWRARILPTMQRMGGKGFKNCADCRNTIAATFQKQVEPWTVKDP